MNAREATFLGAKIRQAFGATRFWSPVEDYMVHYGDLERRVLIIRETQYHRELFTITSPEDWEARKDQLLAQYQPELQAPPRRSLPR